MNAKKRKSSVERRKSLVGSLKRTIEGGLTTQGAKLMADSLGGTKTVCTITHYCRTTVFEYPGCRMVTDNPVPYLMLCANEAFRAALVLDLPIYFQCEGSVFPHYGIDISLRDGIDRVWRKMRSQKNGPHLPIFLVTEQYERPPVTTLANGECFLIDEWRNGQAMIDGGREGKRALLAIRTIDGVWPNFSCDQHAVNTLLAAVKVEQNVTHHLEDLYSCSCFVSEDGRAVYTIHPMMSVNYGGARVSSPVDTSSLREKVARVRLIHERLRQDSVTTPRVAELIDSILLDKTQDDGYFRLWYLRSWEALVDAKKLLGHPGLENELDIIAGELTPKRLKEYRNDVAHWWTGKVDFSFVTGIQKTVQKLLRRKYQKEPSD